MNLNRHLSDFVDFIEIAKALGLICEQDCPYSLSKLLYQNSTANNIIELYSFGESFMFEGLDRQSRTCSIQVVNFVSGLQYMQLEKQIRLLLKMEMSRCQFAEYIKWPIYMVPRGEVVQGPVSNFKFAIVSAVDTITLENLSQQAEDVAVICAKLNITYDDFLCNIFEQIIKCVFMMHQMKIAHRNIRPCNIVYKDHKWKLANFHYALEYDKMIDFYEIVGDDKFIYLELQRLRKRDNYYKKVKQNLLFNDLYAVYMCFRQLALPGESKICQLNQTILAISSLDGLEQLMAMLIAHNQDLINDYQLVYSQFRRAQNKSECIEIQEGHWLVSPFLLDALEAVLEHHKKFPQHLIISHLELFHFLNYKKTLQNIANGNCEPANFKLFGDTYHLLNSTQPQFQKSVYERLSNYVQRYGCSQQIQILLDINYAILLKGRKQFDEARTVLIRAKDAFSYIVIRNSQVLEIRQLVLRSLCDCNDTLSIEDNDAKIDNQLNLISKNGMVNLHPLINLQLGKKKPYHLRMVELLIGNCVKREESLSNSSLRILSDYYHKNREYRKLNKLIEYFYNEITEVPSKLELKALTHFALGEFTISKAYFISILQSMNLKPKSKTLNQVNLVFTLHKLGLINEAMKLQQNIQGDDERKILAQGVSYFLLGDMKNAEKKLKAAQSQPQTSEQSVSRAQYFQYQCAKQMNTHNKLSFALNIQKYSENFELIRKYRYTRDYQKGISKCKDSIELSMNTKKYVALEVFQYLIELAKLYLLVGKTEEALVEFKAAQLMLLQTYSSDQFIKIGALMRIFAKWNDMQMMEFWRRTISTLCGQDFIQQFGLPVLTLNQDQIKLFRSFKLRFQHQVQSASNVYPDNLLSNEFVKDLFDNNKKTLDLFNQFFNMESKLFEKQFTQIKKDLIFWIKSLSINQFRIK